MTEPGKGAQPGQHFPLLRRPPAVHGLEVLDPDQVAEQQEAAPFLSLIQPPWESRRERGRGFENGQDRWEQHKVTVCETCVGVGCKGGG